MTVQTYLKLAMGKEASRAGGVIPLKPLSTRKRPVFLWKENGRNLGSGQAYHSKIQERHGAGRCLLTFPRASADGPRSDLWRRRK